MARVRILDLYCGMGGLSLGFALALEGAEIVGLDIDRDAVATYNRNLSARFSAKAIVQDVLKWEPQGEFDVVMAGSPCQPFSLAVNPKYGKVGRTHPLFPTFPRFFDVVLSLKPKVFLLENVKGLLTKRHRDILEEQLRRVEPHYVVKYQILNAAYYGVPQRRERLFVLGIRRDLGVQPSFPEPTHAPEERAEGGKKMFRWVTVREAIGDLLAIPPEGLVPAGSAAAGAALTEHAAEKKLIQTNPRHGKPAELDEPSRTVKVDGRGGDFAFDTILVPLILTPEQAERIRREREDTTRHRAKMEFPDNLDKPARTISSHTLEGTKRETIVVPVSLDTEYQRKHPPLNPDEPSRTLPSHMAKTSRDALVPCLSSEVLERIHRSGVGLRTHDLDRSAMTVKGVTGGPQNTEPYLAVGSCYRRLTVREALRLQSFPDWWEFPPGVSATKKYRLVGEAVPPILSYRIALHVGRLMGWRTREPPKPEDWQLPYFRRAFADYYSSLP